MKAKGLVTVLAAFLALTPALQAVEDSQGR